MRINENVVLVGARVALVPYRVEHVPRYHVWLQSEELLAATCSEPMSLEAHYAMQRSWLLDDDKCTFIIVDLSCGPDAFAPTRSPAAMVGDVNLFRSVPDEPACVEVDVMIAEPSARRRGCAREAVQLLMRYALDEPALAATAFVAKINDDNAASLALFAQLGYAVEAHSDVFAQTTLRWTLTEATRARLEEQTQHMTRTHYDASH